MRLRLTLGPDASWQTPTLDPAESEVSASPRKAGGGVASVFNLTVFIRSCKTLLLGTKRQKRFLNFQEIL